MALAACRDVPVVLPQVRATVERPADTLRFAAPAAAFRCDSTSDLMFEAVRSTDGVMVWLRRSDAAAHELPIIGVRDTITRPGAVVTARFGHQGVQHTVALDSGTVTVADSSGLVVAVTGSGLDVGFAVRVRLTARFDPLPASPDSSRSCRRVG